MLAPAVMQNSASNTGQNDPDDNSQHTSSLLGSEAMLQLLQSRQRNMRSSMEAGVPFATGMHQGGFGQNPQAGGLSNDMNQDMYSEGRDMFSDGGMGLQASYNMGNMGQTQGALGQLGNSNQSSFLGGSSDMMNQFGGGMQNTGDGSMEDELLRLLLQRRQSMRTGASNFGQQPNNMFQRNEPSFPAATGDLGSIQSLTDELLRVYAQNRTLLAQQLIEDGTQPLSQSGMGQGTMGQHHPGANLPPAASIGHRDIMQMTDTTGMTDQVDAPERIEPVPLTMHDLAVRDHFKRREQQVFGHNDDLKRQFLESRPSLGALGTTDDLKRQFLESRRSLGSVGTGHDQHGFDFGAPGSSRGMRPDDSPKPRKKRKTQRKKPADMPRRPLSAYNLFFSEERERILLEIAAKSEAASGETSEDGASPALKSDPDAEGDDEKKSIIDSLDDKSSTVSGDADEPKVQCKALLRPLVPSKAERRPHRKTHGKISFQSLAQLVGKRWKNLTPERRKYYQDLADEDMKRQRAAMEEYYKKKEKKARGEVEDESLTEGGDSEFERLSMGGEDSIEEGANNEEPTAEVSAGVKVEDETTSQEDEEPSQPNETVEV